ncbi:MAG: DUF3995 domain-containing protein [Gemmatimonadales bacterium]
MSLIAPLLAALLATLALIHLYWGVRGVGASAAVPTHPDGTPLFRPGRLASFLVAVALLFAATIILGRAHLLELPVPPGLLRLGTWGVATAFAARAVGDFRHVGLFKQVCGTPFARWDTVVFTPICLAIAGAASIVALTPS